MPGLQPEEFYPMDYDRLAEEVVHANRPELFNEDPEAFYEAVAAASSQLLEFDKEANHGEEGI